MASLSPAAIAGACVAAVAVCGGVAVTTLAPKGDVALFGAAPGPITPRDAVRLAQQATFGPTVQTVNEILGADLNPWLDQQFAMKVSTYADLAARPVPSNTCSKLPPLEQPQCNRDFLSVAPVALRFYKNALENPDQLRQRVALALSELVVVGGGTIGSTAGGGTYHQMLLDNAFGNYRDILKQVTLSPYMGRFLNMANSNKTAPNENYARELMQLFSLGVYLLNPDGTLQRDPSGSAIQTYSSADVHEVARALTGWTYARLNNAPVSDDYQIDYSQPMIPRPDRYDTGAKTFLGRTVPAGASQTESIDAVVDAVFTHANTPPFISSFLIKQLVTSNPSPAYVGRVAAVFADNGAGVRGDLKAVVRAILTDPEARGDTKAGGVAGKVKEPILVMTSIARLAGHTGDGAIYVAREAGMGEQVFRSPSVFNFYPPDYPLPLSNGLISPSSKLITTTTVLARHNVAYDWTIGGDANRGEFKATPGVVTNATGTVPNWAMWEAVGQDVENTLNWVGLLTLAGEVTPAQREAMKQAMLAVTNNDPIVQARRRAQVALYLATSSPQFTVDR